MNKPNPDELLSLLVMLAREGAPKSHIAQEFECAFRNYGVGSSEADMFFPSQTARAEWEAKNISARRLGGRIEDSWWVPQDRDQRWIDEQTDNIDPKSFK